MELGTTLPKLYDKFAEAKRKYEVRIFYYFKDEKIIREYI